MAPPTHPCIPGPTAFAVRGGVGMAGVSVVAFAVWAFWGSEVRGVGGERALYTAIAGVYLLLTGLVLHPLILGTQRIVRFYRAFVPAFAAYAVAWSVFWFRFRLGAGEWLGGFMGSILFVMLLAWHFQERRGVTSAIAVFFAAHTAGYFAGGQAMAFLAGLSRHQPVPLLDAHSLLVLAKLSWGLFYGLGFGVGTGYVLWALQRQRRLESTERFTPTPSAPVSPGTSDASVLTNPSHSISLHDHKTSERSPFGLRRFGVHRFRRLPACGGGPGPFGFPGDRPHSGTGGGTCGYP